MVVDIQQPVQSVLITTKDLSTNLAHGEVYSMQNYQHYFTDMVRSVSLVEETGLPEKNQLQCDHEHDGCCNENVHQKPYI